jgi:hypothetical protein
MSYFNNISQYGIDYLLIQMDQFSGEKYRPELGQTVDSLIRSGSTEEKATFCFRALTSWQMRIQDLKYEQSDLLLNTKKRYESYLDSQRALHQLQKKFNRLVMGSLDPSAQEEIYKTIGRKWQDVTGIYLTEEGQSFLGYSLLKFHPGDPFCLIDLSTGRHPCIDREIFKPQIELYHLNPQHLPDVTLVSALYFVAQQIPLAANCWHPGSLELTKSNLQKRQDASDRYGELVQKGKDRFRAAKSSSRFIHTLIDAKVDRGAFVNACEGSCEAIFSRLIKQRRVDLKINLCCITPGDHSFIVAGGAGENEQKYVLDTWNGCKLYSVERINDLLYDFKGMKSDGSPVLQRFDPQRQKIKIITSNFYSAKEFRKKAGIPIPEIVQLLKVFETIPPVNRNEKMQQAWKIVITIRELFLCESYLANDFILNDLLEQMLYLTKKEKFV